MLKFISNMKNLGKIDNFYGDLTKPAKESVKNECLKISFCPTDLSF